MPVTKEYLTAIDQMMRDHSKNPSITTLHGFILRHGRDFQITKKSFPKLGKMKQCFMNAYKLADRDHTLTYVEGFANGIIPVHHAWCVDRHDNVVDPTWRDGQDYFGVPFQLRAVVEGILRREAYGSLIDDWEAGWPLLTGKVALESVLVQL